MTEQLNSVVIMNYSPENPLKKTEEYFEACK